MVKGTSRQVIVVDAPEPKLFEQAIFILKNDAVAREGISDEALLKEAKKLLHSRGGEKAVSFAGPIWACGGAAATGLIWLLSTFL
ncbi:MAG: translation initiation factor 2 [Oscillospiraceae bacterium]|nr:translation initiation factor 2 [Oscillospiraceae bacterium]